MSDFNTKDWALNTDGHWVYVGAPLADDHGREAREDRATFYDLDR
jgi:hypothetical protein